MYPSQLEDESIPLKIGDFVLLKSVLNRDGLLSASGILDNNIHYDLKPAMYDEGVFQICYPNQVRVFRFLSVEQASIEKQPPYVLRPLPTLTNFPPLPPPPSSPLTTVLGRS